MYGIERRNAKRETFSVSRTQIDFDLAVLTLHREIPFTNMIGAVKSQELLPAKLPFPCKRDKTGYYLGHS